MRIENRVYDLRLADGATWLDRIAPAFAEALGPHAYPLRFSMVQTAHGGATMEASVVCFDNGEPYATALSCTEFLKPRRKTFQAQNFGVVQVIPTGLRCEFGGYAGDAAPVTNLLAASADFLVTHPNAVNASELNEMAENTFYVEGKALDDFLLGHLALSPSRSNRIGTFVDPTGTDYLDYIINTLNAARSVKGIACGLYAMLDQEFGVRIEWSQTGCAVGTVLAPEAVLRAVDALLERGADAVGGVSVIHGVTAEMFARHMRGEIPNPSGGVEAIITHLITKLCRVPSAHAPLPYYQSLKGMHTANPRAAAEFISTPHYYCVLKGLARAPRLVELATLEQAPPHLITVNHIGAIVLPASCLGGIPAMAGEYSRIPVIAVRENATVLNVNNECMGMPNVVEVESYLEAAGVILALREGIALESLRRPLCPPRRVS
jgi:Protein of unknown function (DUF3326)